MNKVLIYMHEAALEKHGGPAGYNYALRSKLNEMGVENISYIPGGKTPKHLAGKLKKSFWGSIIVTIKDFVELTKLMYGKSKKPAVNLNDYDVVHFHSCRDLYGVKDYLKDYKGKVVLTSHNPCVSSQEIIAATTPWSQKHLMWHYKKLIKIDEYAFDRADYIVFPCEDAEEPYDHTWTGFKAMKDRRKNNFRYVLTGTYQCNAKRTREEVLKEYGIPEDAFVVSYVGRHNVIKGFDQLKLIGEQFIKQHDNVYFLIAGNEFPIKGLKDKHWVEVGWTNDPHSIIAASDVFVLPNKETYFDLILLEVLSLGKIVIASNTGGNKYFKGKLDNGLLLYDNIDQALKELNEVYSLDKAERQKIENANKDFFTKYLSLEPFAKNYIEFYDSIK